MCRFRATRVVLRLTGLCGCDLDSAKFCSSFQMYTCILLLYNSLHCLTHWKTQQQRKKKWCHVQTQFVFISCWRSVLMLCLSIFTGSAKDLSLRGFQKTSFSQYHCFPCHVLQISAFSHCMTRTKYYYHTFNNVALKKVIKCDGKTKNIYLYAYFFLYSSLYVGLLLNSVLSNSFRFTRRMQPN